MCTSRWSSTYTSGGLRVSRELCDVSYMSLYLGDGRKLRRGMHATRGGERPHEVQDKGRHEVLDRHILI
jgi:hypothetical protein